MYSRASWILPKHFKRLFPLIMEHGSIFVLVKISFCFTIVCHRTFKTNVLIILRWKESTLRCKLFLSVHNFELYENIGVMLDLNSFVFTLIVKSLFISRCFIVFPAFIARTFLLLMSFCVSSRLPSSLQSLQRLSELALLMMYSSVFDSFIFDPRWASLTGSSSFVCYIALILLDILLMSSAYCWSMSIW